MRGRQSGAYRPGEVPCGTPTGSRSPLDFRQRRLRFHCQVWEGRSRSVGRANSVSSDCPAIQGSMYGVGGGSRFPQLIFAYGGGGGIRTHGALARTTVFETAPFDHSGTPPQRMVGRLVSGLACIAKEFVRSGICAVPEGGRAAGPCVRATWTAWCGTRPVRRFRIDPSLSSRFRLSAAVRSAPA